MAYKFIKTDNGYETYIDCYCPDFDHVSRLVFWEDNEDPDMDEFYLEFKPLPGKWVNGNRWRKIKFYFFNIWYAIKGQPNTYSSSATWSMKHANQIQEFIAYIKRRRKKGDRRAPGRGSGA